MEPYQLRKVVLRKGNGWGELESVKSKLSMKALNAVGNFYGSYPRTKIMNMGKANLRKANTNTDIYMKTQKEKSRIERGSTIIMVITMVILWCPRVSEFNSSSSSALEGIYFLYK